MRKIIVVTFITLDGVMQAPGGKGEDTSNGFKYGGWVAPYGDKDFGEVMNKQMKATDLLLGRKTFDIFESYWPKHAEHWPGINEVTKYAVSKKRKRSDWKNSKFLNGVADIKKLKKTKGSDLKVWGSGKLIQTLFKNDLVDEMWLKIFPITLGKGKNLFAEGVIPTAFKLTESSVTSAGVIIANYKRTGKVKTATIKN
jgi:dihydrofolate reductase